MIKPKTQDAIAKSLEKLKTEGNYRVFTDILRQKGDFPKAIWYGRYNIKQITNWCSNDYLGMGQHPVVIDAMHHAIDEIGAGSGFINRQLKDSAKEHGVDVVHIASDTMEEEFSNEIKYTEILQLSAIEAIAEYPECTVWIASRFRTFATDFVLKLIEAHPTGKLTIILISDDYELEEIIKVLDDNYFERLDDVPDDCIYCFPNCMHNDILVVYIRN
jgi:hypothetical protein